MLGSNKRGLLRHPVHKSLPNNPQKTAGLPTSALRVQLGGQHGLRVPLSRQRQLQFQHFKSQHRRTPDQCVSGLPKSTSE
jgi:hypothetical protein